MELQNPMPMPWTTCGNLTCPGCCSRDEFMSTWILNETFVFNPCLTTSIVLVFEWHFSSSFEKYCLCLWHHLCITWCSGSNFLIPCLQSVHPLYAGYTLGLVALTHQGFCQSSTFLKDECPYSPILYLKQNKNTKLLWALTCASSTISQALQTTWKDKGYFSASPERPEPRNTFPGWRSQIWRLYAWKKVEFLTFSCFQDQLEEMLAMKWFKAYPPKWGRQTPDLDAQSVLLPSAVFTWKHGKFQISFSPYHIFTIFKCSHISKIRRKAFFFEIFYLRMLIY